MTSIDTNLLFAACNSRVRDHEACRAFLDTFHNTDEFVISELVLTEFYTLLRNPTVMDPPLSAREAVKVVRQFRGHPRWRVVENAPVMEAVWRFAEKPKFPRRHIYDARIALTLIHHGVTHFATANVSDFQEYGFEKVWNPVND